MYLCLYCFIVLSSISSNNTTFNLKKTQTDYSICCSLHNYIVMCSLAHLQHW